jgi:hypothetical protein
MYKNAQTLRCVSEDDIDKINATRWKDTPKNPGSGEGRGV